MPADPRSPISISSLLPHYEGAQRASRGAWILAIFFTFFVGCAVPYGKVSERRVRVLPPPPGLGALAKVEAAIADGLRHAGQDPRDALSRYVAALHDASTALARNPQDETARRDYNFALSRIFTVIRQAHLDPWTHRIELANGFVIESHPDRRPERNAALYEFIPADEVDCRGAYITQRSTKAGLGAPLVAVRKDPLADHKEKFLAAARIYYGVTAVANFEGKRCVIAFHDPLQEEDVTCAGCCQPLAADYTLSLAMLLARERPDKLEVSRLFRPEKYAHTARIARMETYNPAKIPVLIIHGLMGSSATWVPMLNQLRTDPFIRRHYQFWFFSYPSGYPIPKSELLLREQMDAVNRAYPDHKKFVVIGHSMGAVLTRLAISDSGMKLWNATFRVPPGQVNLPTADKDLLTRAYIFHPRFDVSRAILIAGPQKGSRLATSWLARLGMKFIRAPRSLTSLASRVRNILTVDTAGMRLNRAPNSVDTLSPDNRFVKGAADLPIPASIPYHTIIGDRGRGDSPDSSDGIVDYWSSHMDGAVSEKIIPSNHNAHKHADGIAEVQRILHLHAGDPRYPQSTGNSSALAAAIHRR